MAADMDSAAIFLDKVATGISAVHLAQASMGGVVGFFISIEGGPTGAAGALAGYRLFGTPGTVYLQPIEANLGLISTSLVIGSDILTGETNYDGKNNSVTVGGDTVFSTITQSISGLVTDPAADLVINGIILGYDEKSTNSGPIGSITYAPSQSSEFSRSYSSESTTLTVDTTVINVSVSVNPDYIFWR